MSASRHRKIPVPGSPIAPGEVAEWFRSAVKKGKVPTAENCEPLSDRLNDIMGIVSRWGLEPAQHKRDGDLTKAFCQLISQLEAEIKLYTLHETEIYGPGRRPDTTYSDCLSDILAKVLRYKSLIIDNTKNGWPSTLNWVTEEIAGRILGLWNAANNRETVTIGRDSPCESVLVQAMARVTGTEYERTRLQSELARSNKKTLMLFANLDPKLLRMLPASKR